MQLTPKKIKGFTILEVVIVLAIVGVVSAIGIPKFNSWNKDMYSFVESSGVTPFAARAREKIFPALLVGLSIKELNLYDKNHVSNEKKINFLTEVEENVFMDDKIENSESSFSENKSIFTLANSKGFLSGYKSSSFSASCVAVAKSNGSMERDYAVSYTHLTLPTKA